jgi:hypothetical protein
MLLARRRFSPQLSVDLRLSYQRPYRKALAQPQGRGDVHADAIAAMEAAEALVPVG